MFYFHVEMQHEPDIFYIYTKLKSAKEATLCRGIKGVEENLHEELLMKC